jgi:His/Glu/Gln/Arg/opine family amino acid ABC transporter permease subunit
MGPWGGTMILLLQGAIKTLQLWIFALSISLSIGTLFGIVRSKRARVGFASTIIELITFVLRGIPFYVQLLIAYFVIPELLGISISATSAAVLSLSFCSAAYASQIVKGGMNAIGAGQWEAGYVLGYSTWQTVRYIILSQVIRFVIPSLVGEADQLLKSTAIISSIGIMELTGVARNIIAREMNPLTMYVAIACIYLCISSVLNFCGNVLERRLSR